MTYDVDYFIRKFKAIPEYEIGKSILSNKCAYWHCGLLNYNTPTVEAQALSDIMDKLAKTEMQLQRLHSGSTLGWSVIGVNDHIYDFNYPQPTPKQRILAALYDIKKMQEPKQEKPKEITIDYTKSVPVTFKKIVEDIPVLSN